MYEFSYTDVLFLYYFDVLSLPYNTFGTPFLENSLFLIGHRMSRLIYLGYLGPLKRPLKVIMGLDIKEVTR